MTAIETFPSPEALESGATEQERAAPRITETSLSKAPVHPPEVQERLQAELKRVEGEIDELRQELHLAWEAEDRRKEADREQEALRWRESQQTGFWDDVKRLFGRKRKPKIGGRMTDEESRHLNRGQDEIESHLHKLLKERDRLEEELLDLETLRERRKTRWSKDYVAALKETGRALTGEEKYQMGQGEQWYSLIVDQEIEDLKDKREGREPRFRYR